MNPSRPPAAPSRSRPTDFAFEVHYVRQMPSDVPVWAEKVLIVGSWWIRRFARDGRNTAVVVVLIWALANLYQFSHGEEIIGLLTPGMVSFGIILWLTGHGIGILFGGLPLHHRVVLLPPGVKRTLPFRYKLLDAACAAVLVTVLAWAAWETRPAATEARRQHVAKCQLAADLLRGLPPECLPPAVPHNGEETNTHG